MLLNYEINTNLKIENLMDLPKLKILEEESNFKVNKSKIARELNVDRRTVKKYMNGFKKSNRRTSRSKIDDYYDIMLTLLQDNNKIFAYKRVLWQYLCDNYGMRCSQSMFRKYIGDREELQVYFNDKTKKSNKAVMRFESECGKQAQLDWKESMEIILKNGDIITVNIFVMILSYSRFRVYRLSLNKTQDILFSFLDDAFETIGGVPDELITDNMKTVMDKPRTQYSKGKVNNKFQQFADDYGFKVKPCIAGRPQTKSKVESPMRILDELRAYNGDLDYEGLVLKLQDINHRENSSFHKSYSTLPILALKKEKDFLFNLPGNKIRNHYSIKTNTVKVNSSSMISFNGNYYSVPPKYINKNLQLQIHDNQIHLYSNMNLVSVHTINNKKLNYLKEHYIQIMKKTKIFNDDNQIEKIAKDNLKKIGEKYR